MNLPWQNVFIINRENTFGQLHSYFKLCWRQWTFELKLFCRTMTDANAIGFTDFKIYYFPVNNNSEILSRTSKSEFWSDWSLQLVSKISYRIMKEIKEYLVVQEHWTSRLQLIFVDKRQHTDVVFTAHWRRYNGVIIINDFLQVTNRHRSSSQFIDSRTFFL